jgi:hypothetical protein
MDNARYVITVWSMTVSMIRIFKYMIFIFKYK